MATGEQFNLAGQCFLGMYDKTIDTQRRIALPRPWRQSEQGGDQFVLLPGRTGCLQLIPGAMFATLFEKLRQVSFADREAGIALASLAAVAQMVVCDSQGRIQLTGKLMEMANLDKNSVLVGAFTSIQIWAPEAWKASQMDTEKCLDALQALQERPDEITNILRNALKR